VQEHSENLGSGAGREGPSGGRLSHIELGVFLSSGNGPEQQALFRLIATLVDVPPFGEWR
jgi:hypothetical protein